MKDLYEIKQYKLLIDIKNNIDKSINNYDLQIKETKNKIQLYINNGFQQLLKVLLNLTI